MSLKLLSALSKISLLVASILCVGCSFLYGRVGLCVFVLLDAMGQYSLVFTNVLCTTCCVHYFVDYEVLLVRFLYVVFDQVYLREGVVHFTTISWVFVQTLLPYSWNMAAQWTISASLVVYSVFFCSRDWCGCCCSARYDLPTKHLISFSIMLWGYWFFIKIILSFLICCSFWQILHIRSQRHFWWGVSCISSTLGWFNWGTLRLMSFCGTSLSRTLLTFDLHKCPRKATYRFSPSELWTWC